LRCRSCGLRRASQQFLVLAGEARHLGLQIVQFAHDRLQAFLIPVALIRAAHRLHNHHHDNDEDDKLGHACTSALMQRLRMLLG
jgi:hypothetical protein